MIERERLAGVQTETNAARERRGEAVAAMIGQFRTSVEQALARLRAAAGASSTRRAGSTTAADAVSSEARSAETRVGAASVNVTTVASSIEELAASIGEIASQATQVDRSREPRRRRIAAHRQHHVANWAAPRTASAR